MKRCNVKLVTYSKEETVSCAILTDKGLIDIPSAWKGPNTPRSVVQILENGPQCLEKLKNIADSAAGFIPLDSVNLLAPIPRPGKCLALAGNYAKHLKEVGKKIGMSDSPRNTTTPRPFLMPSTVVIGTDREIPWPVYSETIDYEIELGVVIGKKAKFVAPENALEYVAGYTIVNDVSARTVTFKHGRIERPWDDFYDWLNGKWADAFLPMGPYLLTADEVPDVQNLNLSLTVNEKQRQNSNTSQMIYPVADIVAFLSNLMTLEPGDIIATGTPEGVALPTGNFLKAGDIIQCRIDLLGTLTNTLGPEPQQFYKPLA
ncbi:MAG: FAA hydrolase family protein [Candidatus Brocadiia bacterium]|nr:MAG: FAA hydrolase family protein [Candidatus Brocadiia bacterium]